MDVIFQARMRMLARQIDIARRHFEMPMNEVDQTMRQVAGKIRTVIGGPVFFQAARHIHARISFAGELDVGISLVVAQQDVVARLVLLDEIIFERQRFFFVVDLNEIDGPRFADQRSGFDVGQAVVIEVAADPAAEIFCLADVDDGAVGVFVEIHSGQQRQFGDAIPELKFVLDNSIFPLLVKLA